MRCEYCKTDPKTIYSVPASQMDGKLDTQLCLTCLVANGFFCSQHEIAHGLGNPYGTACIRCVLEAESEHEDFQDLYNHLFSSVDEREHDELSEAIDCIRMLGGVSPVRVVSGLLYEVAALRSCTLQELLDVVISRREGVRGCTPHPLGLPAYPMLFNGFDECRDCVQFLESLPFYAGNRTDADQYLLASWLQLLEIGNHLRSYLMQRNGRRPLTELEESVAARLVSWFATPQGLEKLRGICEGARQNPDFRVNLGNWYAARVMDQEMSSDIFGHEDALTRTFGEGDEFARIGTQVCQWLATGSGWWFAERAILQEIAV